MYSFIFVVSWRQKVIYLARTSENKSDLQKKANNYTLNKTNDQEKADHLNKRFCKIGK